MGDPVVGVLAFMSFTSLVLFQITWRRNGESLRSVSAVSSTVVETLRIEGSGKFGNYSCSASNSISSSSSRLEFSGKYNSQPPKSNRSSKDHASIFN